MNPADYGARVYEMDKVKKVVVASTVDWDRFLLAAAKSGKPVVWVKEAEYKDESTGTLYIHSLNLEDSLRLHNLTRGGVTYGKITSPAVMMTIENSGYPGTPGAWKTDFTVPSDATAGHIKEAARKAYKTVFGPHYPTTYGIYTIYNAATKVVFGRL